MKKRYYNRKSKKDEDSAEKIAPEKEKEKSSSAVKCKGLLRIRTGFLALFIVYLSVPFVLYCFPWILGHVIYCHSFRIPFFVDLRHPEDLSLNHTINFYLTPEEGVTVGVWQTVPDNQWQEAQGKDLEWYKESLKDSTPVIIYLHGNMGNRGLSHRVELIKVLSAAGFNVITMDYRGYGDSTGQPSESGMTADTVYLYHWVKASSGSSSVCLWGHSLGSGVATNAALKLQSDGFPVDCVILEAPFTNIYEETATHPFSMIYWIFPGFENVIRYALVLNNLTFPNDENLKTLRSQLLLLHAEDDNVVPFHMSQKLYQIAKDTKSKHVRMETYSQSLGYFHNQIYRDPQLLRKIWQFLHLLEK